MFTGIIEALGQIKSIEEAAGNRSFWIEAPFYSELKIDQSVAHNGVCLTVDKLDDKQALYRVTAVDETLKVTALGGWKAGDQVNLERCMKLGARLDGHIVQGHVDSTAICSKVEVLEGSHLFTFSLEKPSKLMVEKGSICINGTSLTCFEVDDHSFKVTIIPYTLEFTNFHSLKEGDRVNLEFDIIGKYVARLFPAD